MSKNPTHFLTSNSREGEAPLSYSPSYPDVPYASKPNGCFGNPPYSPVFSAIIKRHAVLSVVVSLNKHPRILCLQITLSALWLSLIACFGAPAFFGCSFE
ncbi:hypothetical protein Q3G72_021250 [Acer saccharum]|nr:hypothetical protein Q3G72_021250 [Acer saccharum]